MDEQEMIKDVGMLVGAMVKACEAHGYELDEIEALILLIEAAEDVNEGNA